MKMYIYFLRVCVCIDILDAWKAIDMGIGFAHTNKHNCNIILLFTRNAASSLAMDLYDDLADPSVSSHHRARAISIALWQRHVAVVVLITGPDNDLGDSNAHVVRQGE